MVGVEVTSLCVPATCADDLHETVELPCAWRVPVLKACTYVRCCMLDCNQFAAAGVCTGCTEFCPASCLRHQATLALQTAGNTSCDARSLSFQLHVRLARRCLSMLPGLLGLIHKQGCSHSTHRDEIWSLSLACLKHAHAAVTYALQQRCGSLCQEYRPSQ